MSTNCARQFLKIAIAQIIQSFGYQSAQSVTLDVLNEILERYILLICNSCREYSELASRTEPTLEDLAVSFERFRINLNELDEFVNYVDMPKFSKDIIKFPNEKENKLGFCDDPNNKELQDRIEDEDKEHVDYYFPLMERKDEPIPVLPILPVPTTNNLNEEKSMINLEESTMEVDKPTTVIKCGIMYDTNMWKSQYDPLGKSLSGYSETIRKEEPIAAQAKFPAFYHKPKIRTKKSISTKTQNENERERERDETNIDIETKINIPMDANITPMMQTDNKSLVDQMIDAVVTKYTTPQVTRRSPSPKIQYMDTRLAGLTGIYDTSSPVKIDDNDVQITQSSSQPQITLKIARSSYESPIKKEPKKKKSLKIVINTKGLNTSDEQKNVTETTELSTSEVNMKDTNKDAVFDSDDENFAEFDEKHDENVNFNDKEEPIIWRPTCNVKTEESLLTNFVSQSNSEQEITKLKIASTTRTQEVLMSSVLISPIKVEPSYKSSTIQNIEEKSNIEMVTTNETIETVDKEKHKKRKKDKEHKKHKKDKHEKREKHKHRIKDEVDNQIIRIENEGESEKQTFKVEQSNFNVIDQVNKPDVGVSVAANESVTPSTGLIPKLKLKLGHTPISEPSKQERTENENSEVVTAPTQLSIPKLLIKPIIKPKTTPVKKVTQKSPKKMQSLKIKLKLETHQHDECIREYDESAVHYDEYESFNKTEEEQLNTTMDTTISNAVDVVNIDDDDNESQDDFANQFSDSMSQMRKKSKLNITDEQMINITETINAVSYGNVNEPIFSNTNVFIGETIIKSEEKKKEKKSDKHKRSLDVYNFDANIGSLPSGDSDREKSKKDKKHKKKHKNKDSSPSRIGDEKHSKSSKKHRDRMSVTNNEEQIDKNLMMSVTTLHSTQSASIVSTTPQKLNDCIPLASLLSSLPILPTQSQSQTQQQTSNQITMSVTSEIYDQADKVWICPLCSNFDDGTPMIGCDSCDDWYHWKCVGINQEPPENQQWYCHKCGAGDFVKKKKKKRKS